MFICRKNNKMKSSIIILLVTVTSVSSHFSFDYLGKQLNGQQNNDEINKRYLNDVEPFIRKSLEETADMRDIFDLMEDMRNSKRRFVERKREKLHKNDKI